MRVYDSSFFFFFFLTNDCVLLFFKYREKLHSILSSRVDVFSSHIARLRDNPAVKNATQYLEISAEEESIASTTKSLPSLLLDITFVDFFKDVYGIYIKQE